MKNGTVNETGSRVDYALLSQRAFVQLEGIKTNDTTRVPYRKSTEQPCKDYTNCKGCKDGQDCTAFTDHSAIELIF